VEIDSFLTRTGKAGSWKKDKSLSSPETLRYTVLGPTRVAIRDPGKPKDAPKDARLEGGKWRLHLSMDGR
jgi:hypothetical protein